MGTYVIAPVPPTAAATTEITYAGFQVAASAALVADYYRQHSRAVNRLERGIDFQEQVNDWYHTFYIEHESEHRLRAVLHAMDMSIAVEDPTRYYRRISAYIRGLFSCASDWEEQLLGASCNTDAHRCDTRVQGEIERATVSAAHHLLAGQKLRELEYLQKRVQAVSNVIRIAKNVPSAIFNETANYLNVYSELRAITANGINGALGTIGLSLGKIATHLQNREEVGTA